jgi:hypothetical protein
MPFSPYFNHSFFLSTQFFSFQSASQELQFPSHTIEILDVIEKSICWDAELKDRPFFLRHISNFQFLVSSLLHSRLEGKKAGGNER